MFFRHVKSDSDKFEKSNDKNYISINANGLFLVVILGGCFGMFQFDNSHTQHSNQSENNHTAEEELCSFSPSSPRAEGM